MPDSLQIALKNDSDTDEIYAYITGIAIQQGGQRCLLKANGKDLYYPRNAPHVGSPLEEDCAIPLLSKGQTKTVIIPQIAGGRIWFSVGGKLTFLLNPSDAGPALVEPSVLNPSDPNADVDFAFCEFTLNDAQLYANISYVDFVPRLPIAITLQETIGQLQHVAGMGPDGLDRMADGLRAQSQQDGIPWDKLVVNRNGRNLRILNATHGGAVGASFDGYYEPHVEEVWNYYANSRMKINTQAGPGILEGYINRKGELQVGDEVFSKPNTADILGCNSGPFTTGPEPIRNAIIPRLAAAFHRTAFLRSEEHPSHPSTFYKQDPTNRYARLVHELNVDRKGYAFAYDDVQPDDGEDQSGKVNGGDPIFFTVTVGGIQAGERGGATNPNSKNGTPSPSIRERESSRDQYDRPPPPPPAETCPQPQHQISEQSQAGGLRSKVKGFASKILK
ncbi:glycoside hydrolase family 64 protein [Polychaeton citri CBS 116435]|uniref:Glycoside hydrolase family 64 protein n=1 Tax=Polychaeton citri CBS 116435 TaxID=1314669 RepID=A0A9P4UTX7_9PEZI|nr:glycoside hydrolase family 64 protein [Polychaeton citri CBS 116435]